MNLGRIYFLLITLMLISSLILTPTPKMALCQGLPREKTLVVFIDGGRVADPTTWNPFLIGSRRDHGLHQVLTEYFFYYNLTDGTLFPWLATGFEYSENYTVLKVFLRKGVKWSDGVPFTADDVVFTYNMLLEYAPKLQHSDVVEEFVKEVVKIDDYTVELRLKKPNLRFHYTWGFPTVTLWGGLPIVPKHIWEGKDPLTFKNYPPVFTGPYKLVEYSPAGDRFVYERRDDWWATEVFGIRPAPQYVIFVHYDTEEIYAMKMVTNEIDYRGDFELSTFLEIKNRNPYVRSWLPDHPYAYFSAVCDRLLLLNNEKYPWSLKEVRWAISYLIDRNAIASIAYEGTTRPLRTPMAEIPPMLPWINMIEDLLKKYNTTEYNPEKAYRIFEELGFTRGSDGVWVTPNGTRLEMVIEAPAPWIEKKRWALVAIDYLRAGGIDAKLKILEIGPWMNDIQLGYFDAATVWHCPAEGAYEPYTYMVHYHSKYWRPIGEAGVGFVTRFRNATYDKYLDTMLGLSPEDPKYREAYRKAMEIWLDQLPEIPIALSRKITTFNTYYWLNWPTSENPWWSPQMWHAYIPLYINLKPRFIDYAVVYFIKDTPKFRGVDLIWYGPYEVGDSARIPLDDAEFLIKKGYASYTPPSPTVPPGISESLSRLLNETLALRSDISAKISALENEITALRGELSIILTVSYTVIIVAIIVLVAAVALVLRKPK